MLKEWDDHQGPFVARVVRSIEKCDWSPHGDSKTQTADGSTQLEFQWKFGNDVTFEKSIEQSYVYALSCADRFIYIETQYFIGSGYRWGRDTVKNGVPEAIVERICEKIVQGQDFHAYIVIPQFPEGTPDDAVPQLQRYFEWNTMKYMAQAVAAEATKKGKD